METLFRFHEDSVFSLITTSVHQDSGKSTQAVEDPQDTADVKDWMAGFVWNT